MNHTLVFRVVFALIMLGFVIWVTWFRKPIHLKRHATYDRMMADHKRMEWLEKQAPEAVIGFEWEGGIYVTLDKPGLDRVAARECNSVREGIDKLMRGEGQVEF